MPGQHLGGGQKRGEATGPNPIDRVRLGCKRHLLTDRTSLPLAFLLTEANTHESVPTAELLDAVVPVPVRRGSPTRKPAKLHGCTPTRHTITTAAVTPAEPESLSHASRSRA